MRGVVSLLFLGSVVSGSVAFDVPPAGDGWTTVASKGKFTDYDAGAAAFASAMAQAPHKLVRRDCPSCENPDAKYIIYKRLTPLPDYDLLEVFKSNWTVLEGNFFNVDFELYSSLDDALAGRNRWTFCNGDDYSGVGAFRDCGPHDHGIHVAAQQETYEGMDSNVSPCSGFVTVDDAGRPCAGFRQCGSSKGTTGLNPKANTWDVPLELRCSENGNNMTAWGAPDFIFPFYYFRALPYDPVRPWKDEDGQWYVAMSTDACNATHQKPCPGGGRLDLFTSPKLHGDGADWKQLAPMFTTNTTVSGKVKTDNAITGEFVTSGYFGGLSGDPDGGSTRVITQNRAGPTYWVGKQSNGGAFEAYWDKEGAVGHYDYGSLTMARTLGSDPNQVAKNGRRVLVGWIGGTPASQSLGRDLTLSADYELLQQFVPELKALRIGAGSALSVPRGAVGDAARAHSLSTEIASTPFAEIVATFTFDAATPPRSRFGVSVLGAGEAATNVFVDCSTYADGNGCVAGTDSSSQKGREISGPLLPTDLARTAITTATTTSAGSAVATTHIHIYVDGGIVEAIFNNRTAMVAYATPDSAEATDIALFGVGGAVGGELQSWQLKPVNNL